MKPLPNDTKHSLVTGRDAEGQMLQASVDSSVNQHKSTSSRPPSHSLHFVPGMLGRAKPSFEGIRTGEPG